MMALEHPRLLAASLAFAFAAMSCSLPSDGSNELEAVATIDLAAPADEVDAVQDPQSQGTVADQRKAVLVANWIDNARKLRTRGQLQAAKLELLKAKDLAPSNEQVRSELAAVQAH